MTTLGPYLLWPFLLFLLAGGTYDLITRRIPNFVTVPAFVLALLLQLWVRGWTGVGQALLGAALGGGIYLFFLLIKARGAGDLKLMAAAGAFLGPMNWLVFFLGVSVLGGIVALVVLAWNRKAKALPHGTIALLSGVVLAVLWA